MTGSFHLIYGGPKAAIRIDHRSNEQPVCIANRCMIDVPSDRLPSSEAHGRAGSHPLIGVIDG
jgi:hypothetical protein